MLPLVRTTWMPSVFDDLLKNSWIVNDRYDHVSASDPRVNIIENEKEYRIELAAPGLSREDMKIDLDNNVLTLYSEREDAQENSQEYWRKEFGYNSFRKTFTIPETVNTDSITAEYRNGILDVHIPKKPEAIQKAPKQIEIK